jgi:hypothetical protein
MKRLVRLWRIGVFVVCVGGAWAACSSEASDVDAARDFGGARTHDLAALDGAALDGASSAALDGDAALADLAPRADDAGADLAPRPPPDFAAVPGPGCFGILSGAPGTTSPVHSHDLADAFLACVSLTCGSAQAVDGSSASQPCATPSAACDACLSNVQLNVAVTFFDAGGNPIACVDLSTGAPDPNAPTCGACATEIVACLFDCNSDRDCAGLTNWLGAPASCSNHVCGYW